MSQSLEAFLYDRVREEIERAEKAEARVERLEGEKKELMERNKTQAQMIVELRRDCVKMLRRGMKACERQGWEKGESTEAWYHAAGTLAGQLELATKMDAEQAALARAGARKDGVTE